ncbi:MAG: hypothetical protein H7235_04875 [Bdellovibrionaceae bacterium]|nr:hypothetical protein [Pseudobdellovibrionaceae bacterium]
MRTLLLIFVAVIGLQANADVPAHRVSMHKEFSIRSSTQTGWVYYNCDSVEQAVTDLLSKIGASNISVRCSGGIENGQPPMEAYVDVTFDALQLASINDTNIVMANWTPVKIHSWDDCDLKSQIFKDTQAGFAIKDVKISSCSSPSSQFKASLTTLF